MLFRTMLAASLAAAGSAAHAQATVKDDGQWRAALGLGVSVTSGNKDSSSASILGDAVRATSEDKASLYINGLYAKTDDETTAKQLRFGGRYDHNLTPRVFGFGGLDFETNKFANLDWRSQVLGGLGYHVVKSDTTTFDVFGGLSYTHDKFDAATLIDDKVRNSFSYAGVYLGEESTHKLTETTTAKQKLSIYPNLTNQGEYRATFDAGVAVAMTKLLNLTVGLSVNYNSEPGAGFESTDRALTAGVAMKFE